MRQRSAVAALFVSNGVALTVVPRLPELKAALELSDGQLGRALLGMGLGGLAGSTLSRTLLPRLGSRRLALGAALALGLLLPLVAVAPLAAVLFAVLLAVGICDALMDVGMNVSGIAVQRDLGRPVLNGLNALWSAGAVTGGAVGSLAARCACRLCCTWPASGSRSRSSRSSPRARCPTTTVSARAERRPAAGCPGRSR